MMEGPKEAAQGVQHCHFFMARKKRNCRMKVRSGLKYCPEHEIILQQQRGSAGGTDDQPEGTRKRITCPYDPKHTCYADSLRKHLFRCNSRPLPQPAYYSRGINSGDGIDETRIPLPAIPDDVLVSFIQKIKTIHQRISVPYETRIMRHPALEVELENAGRSAAKHLLQTSSLLAHMDAVGLMSDDDQTCYIEFGSGRGQVTFWLTQAVASKHIFVLVDRESHRHKHDNKLKDSPFDVVRIRIDIENLRLDQVEAVVNSKQIVGLSKHLCGVACDLALRCLASSGDKVAGIAMALCCRHRCTWKDYVGRQFLMEQGLSAKEFNLLCSLVSWATCGSGFSRTKEGVPNVLQDMSARYEKLDLSRQHREEIGMQCMAILDYGRAHYLQQHGFTTQLAEYTTKEVSLENIILIATKNISNHVE